jgi:hypothetical protein
MMHQATLLKLILLAVHVALPVSGLLGPASQSSSSTLLHRFGNTRSHPINYKFCRPRYDNTITLYSKASSRTGGRSGKGFGGLHPTSKKITPRSSSTIFYDDEGNVLSQRQQQPLSDDDSQHSIKNVKNELIDTDGEQIHNSSDKPNNNNRVTNFLSNLPKVLSKPPLVSSTSEWRRLQRHASQILKSTHLRDLLQDPTRCDAMWAEHDGVYLDYSRQQATLETMELLFDLAEKQELTKRIDAMVNGEKINFTEDRAVLHTALRASREDVGTVFVDGVDAIGEVHEVLDQIKAFTEAFRSGQITGYTGKRMRNIVSVGIGGSYLGPEFLHEVLKTEEEGINSSLGYSLRFLANVDPVDVERTCADLDPEETLIIIVSKTFTTAETMLNARTMRQWLWDFMGDDIDVVRKHVVACSSVSATENVKKFGIDTENGMFRFWDWVGGRYSVCGAAGAVPISLLYGYDLFEKFLEVSVGDGVALLQHSVFAVCSCNSQRFLCLREHGLWINISSKHQ